MNNYNELSYEELVSTEKELLFKIRSIKTKSEETDSQLKAITSELDRFEKDKEQQIKTRREEALNSIIEEKTRPILTEIEKKYSIKEVYNSDYNKYIASLNKSDFISADNSKLIEDKNSLKRVIYDSKETIKDIVGEGFYENLMRRFKNSTTDINVDDFSTLCKMVYSSNQMLKKLQKLNKFNLFIYINRYFNGKKSIFFFLDSTGGKTKKDSTSNNNNMKLLIYLFICVILTLFVILKGSSILFVLLFFTMIINLLISYKIYQLSYNMKSIEDSFFKVEDLINKEMNSKYDAKVSKAKSKLDSNINKIDKQIEEYTAKQDSIIKDLTENYQPDLSRINEEMKSKFDAKYKVKINLKNEYLKLVTDIQNIKEDLNSIREIKESRFEEMVHNIVNTVNPGEHHTLPDSIVVDANFDLKRLIKWDVPKVSSLFIYETEDDLHEFLLCFINQLLTYTYFRDLEITYVDLHTFGAPLLPFKQSVRQPSSLFFMTSLITNQADCVSMESRLKVNIEEFISKSGGAIPFDEYNNRMREKESSTIPYRILFYKDVEPSRVIDEDFTKSISTMAKSGIIPLYFLAKENLDSLDEKSEKALKRYGNFYNLISGKIETLTLNSLLKFIKGS